MTDPGAATASRAAEAIQLRVGNAVPAAALVLGSGLGAVTAPMTSQRVMAYAEIPGFPTVSVVGHSPRLVAGLLGGQFVIAFEGRVHQYEGHGAAAAAFPVRLARALGAPIALLLDAAGGIRRTLTPGDAMVIEDHINFNFRNPLTGRVERGDQRFPDMSAPYDPELAGLLLGALRAAGHRHSSGVYAGVLGPAYETPAEVRMLQLLGADAVGMSTLPEVIVARATGMRVAALSLITNHASGISDHRLTHEEVVRVAGSAAGRLAGVVDAFVRGLVQQGRPLP